MRNSRWHFIIILEYNKRTELIPTYSKESQNLNSLIIPSKKKRPNPNQVTVKQHKLIQSTLN